MIRYATIVLTAKSAVCAKCGRNGPWTGSEHDALRTALQEGWIVREKPKPHIVCPHCTGEHNEAER